MLRSDGAQQTSGIEAPGSRRVAAQLSDNGVNIKVVDVWYLTSVPTKALGNVLMRLQT
jgi:hypothetical protein